jgi:hypothetical protein
LIIFDGSNDLRWQLTVWLNRFGEWSPIRIGLKEEKSCELPPFTAEN